MNVNALFGRYWDAESPIHALDPRCKLVAMLVITVLLLTAGNYAVLAAELVVIVALYALARIPFRQAFRAIAPLSFIVIMTAILNVFFVQGGTTYASWGIFVISQGGIESAIFLSIRLTLMLLIACLFTLTTTTMDITSAFESVLSPLHRFGVPTYEISEVMGMTLRFLPQIVDEWRDIRAAQASRGADLSTHGNARKLSSLFIPLFTSAFRHAETLSSAMDARCYHGNEGRTRLHPLSFGRNDVCALALVLCDAIACIVLNVL